MQLYPENSGVPFSIEYVDGAGQSFTPTAVSIGLFDGDGIELASLASGTPDPGSTRAEGVVPAIHNQIDADGGLGVRIIIARLTQQNGIVIRREVIYGVEPDEILKTAVNSFQSLPKAIVEASMMVNLTSFNEDTTARQKAALIEAYNRITQIKLTYTMVLDGRERRFQVDASEWATMTRDTFDTQLSASLRRALRQAQIVEADEILRGVASQRKWQDGIQSETIGESSITFRNVVTGSLNNLSNASNMILAPFIDTTLRIGRA